jgi:nucleotide-binding universal stress UspA family protein
MIQIQKILCPVDFSPVSFAALEHAETLARWYSATVHALHVFQPPVALVRTFPQYAGAMLESGARTELLNELDRAVKPVRDRGLRVETSVREGDIHGEIDAAARDLGADLIVMGTHGRSGLPRLVIGSVTEKVLRIAPCPVLTIPPHAAEANRVDGPIFKRILCPVDFSDESMLGVRYALSLAQEAGGKVTLLHVLEWFVEDEPRTYEHYSISEYRRKVEDEARTRLAEAIPASARDWCEAQEMVFAGKPYRQIVRQAEEQKADLIVVGVRGRGGADIALFGSTTNRVVREAGCAVLTVRERPAAEAARLAG